MQEFAIVKESKDKKDFSKFYDNDGNELAGAAKKTSNLSDALGL